VSKYVSSVVTGMSGVALAPSKPDAAASRLDADEAD
jgi:hypothetical protein